MLTNVMGCDDTLIDYKKWSRKGKAILKLQTIINYTNKEVDFRKTRYSITLSSEN